MKQQRGEWLKHQFFLERTSPGPDPTVAAAGVFNVEAGGGHDFIVVDDVVTYQNAILKPAMRDAVYDTLESVWFRRIDPGTKTLYVGTAWHADDASHRLMAQQGGLWRWLIIAVNETFSGLTCRVI